MRLVSRPVDALRRIDDWPCTTAAAVLVSAGGTAAAHGPQEQPFGWASVTKLATALATLVAVEEGVIDLDQPAGPPGATLRHLLAHAAGYAFDEATLLAPPGSRRIYSNVGIEVAAAAVEEAAGMRFGDYLRAAVLDPLGIRAELRGSPAHGLHGPVSGLALLGRELLAPTLVASETFVEATSVQFPGLSGVLPGWGRMEPNDWGLAFELRDAKSPHWTGSRNSPRTLGHFGAAGTFLWVDPDAGIACGVLTDREFGEWAIDAWPAFSDAVLAEAS